MTDQIIISPEEMREELRRNYLRRRDMVNQEILSYVIKKDWQGVVDTALSNWEGLPLAFSFYDNIPDKLKYDFATQAYTHHGDNVPTVRKAVRGALKYGKPTLPEELAAQEEITVYRAGKEPPEKAKYRISWTTELQVALFFLKRGRHSIHLYKGKIKPEHIIAYTDDRSEKEIMQYRHVYDIEELENPETEKEGKR